MAVHYAFYKFWEVSEGFPAPKSKIKTGVCSRFRIVEKQSVTRITRIRNVSMRPPIQI